MTTGKAPLIRATSPRDANDIFLLSSWLKGRILLNNADARYSYAYAGNLHYMKDKNGGFQREAAIWLIHARLALAIDGARCVDRASPDVIANEMESQKYLEPLIDLVSKMPNKEKGAAFVEAVSIEKLRGERKAMGYLCNRGARTIQKAMTAGRQFEPASTTEGEKSKVLGQSYTIDASGIEPEYAPDEQWKAKRSEILNNYLRIAASFL